MNFLFLNAYVYECLNNVAALICKPARENFLVEKGHVPSAGT